jgi:uncharacterized protein (DUF1684 family)
MSLRPSAFLCAFGLLTCCATLANTRDSNHGWRAELEKWRADRAAKLQQPENWLSLIGLEWLKDCDNSVVSDSSNEIQIKAKVPAQIAVVHLEQGKVALRAPAGGFPTDMTVDGKPAAEQTLRPDDQPTRSHVSIGTVSFIVLHRGDRYALRIWDSTSPARANFHGLHWYQPNPKYRIAARWIPYTPPKMLDIPTILGTVDRLPAPGVAEFTLNGKTLRVEPVLEGPDSKELFFILRDTTSTTTTYGAGRFLYADFPSNGLDKPGTVVLDFNRMENPPCSYTPYATCPLPPKQNRMPVPVPAGEKRYHD